jgi:hypothetical protein
MPRRDECVSLSIVDVARAGLLRPHTEGAGHVKSLRDRDGYVPSWVPIRARIGAEEGVLTLHEPCWEVEVRVSSRPAKTRHGRMWSWVCPGVGSGPCGRSVRVLLRPSRPFADTFEPWACRHCHLVQYPRGRRGWTQGQREIIAELERLAEDIADQLRIARSGLATYEAFDARRRRDGLA